MVSISTLVFYDTAQWNGSIFFNHTVRDASRAKRENGGRNETYTIVFTNTRYSFVFRKNVMR